MTKRRLPLTALSLTLAMFSLAGCGLVGAAAGIAATAASKAVDVLVEAPAETQTGEDDAVTVAAGPETTG